jgi:hypothetical protein
MSRAKLNKKKKWDTNTINNQWQSSEEKYWFCQKLEQILIDKYMKHIPDDYTHLLNLLSLPKNLIQKDDKNFRVEKVLKELIDELTIDERYQLIPETVEESKMMKKFIKTFRLELDDDTIWRKITGYANLNFQLTKALAEKLKGKKALEIMSGNGLLSYMLREDGLDTFATDIAPDKSNEYIAMRNGSYGDIKKMDAISAVKKYGQNMDYLLCSWPPQGEEEVLHALETFNKMKKNATLIYIGEWKGGFNATDEFFQRVEIVEKMDEINALHVSHFGANDVIRMVRLKAKC